jgi:RNA polymerase sigma-B factor
MLVLNETVSSRDRQERTLKHYLPLIRPLARHFSERRPDLYDDLSQVGAIGLLRAIERFDETFGVPFEAYANRLIEGEMRHYLRDLASLVKPPREISELRGKVQTAQLALSQMHETSVPPSAVAELTGLPLHKVEAVLAHEENFQPASLDHTLELESGSLRYQLVDNRYKSFQLAEEDRWMLTYAMERLRSVSREVIEFAFYEDLTQTEIAKKLGISQMQVSRRIKSALGEMFKLLNAKI